VDYSFYLGNDYKKQYKPITGKISTYIANHTSGLDSLINFDVLGGHYAPIATIFCDKVPVLSFVCRTADTLYVPFGKG